MALVTSKSVFLHIPKTGGWWIRYAYKLNHISYEEIGGEHSYYPTLYRYREKKFYDSRKSFAIIRHPLTWYQSRWSFRMKDGWRPQHPLDYNCASNDFKIFVRKCLDYEPAGWVTKEYSFYIDSERPLDFIGRQESIKSDFIAFSKLSGETIKAEILDGLPRINHSNLDKKSSAFWAKYDEDLLVSVLQAEHKIIDRFYKDYIIDPNSLSSD